MAIEQTVARPVRILFAGCLAFLFCALSLQAQTGDWKTVRNLPAGTHLIVKAQRNYSCDLEGATDDELICAARQLRSPGTTVVRIPRADVHEVRTLPNQGKSAAIGAGIGAAGGAALGARNKTAPEANAFFGAAAGAGFGALVGAIIPAARLAIHHGKVIYKR